MNSKATWIQYLHHRGDSKLTRVPSSNATVVTALTYTFLAERRFVDSLNTLFWTYFGLNRRWYPKWWKWRQIMWSVYVVFYHVPSPFFGCRCLTAVCPLIYVAIQEKFMRSTWRVTAKTSPNLCWVLMANIYHVGCLQTLHVMATSHSSRHSWVDNVPFPKMGYVSSLEGTNWLLDFVHQTFELRFYVLPWVAMREHCCWCHGVIGFIHYHSTYKSIRKKLELPYSHLDLFLFNASDLCWGPSFSHPDISKTKNLIWQVTVHPAASFIEQHLGIEDWPWKAGPNYGYGWVCWYIYILIVS